MGYRSDHPYQRWSHISLNRLVSDVLYILNEERFQSTIAVSEEDTIMTGGCSRL